MPFDFFLSCVRNGDPATFERSLFEEIMGRGAIDPDFPLQNVDYAEGNGSAIYGGEDDDIDGLMFNHFGPGIFSTGSGNLPSGPGLSFGGRAKTAISP